MRSITKDMIGKKFNMLTVIDYYQGKHQTEFMCLCDCGGKRHFTTHQLTSGNVKSCGCYIKKLTAKRNKKHGQNQRNKMTPEYRAWVNMKNRCYTPSYYLYHRYVGRGITVCERWLNSFENFFADMGKKPTTRHTLDRYPNNDGNYEPENCRWATQKQQGRNMSRNVLIEINGVVKCASEWAEIYNLTPKLILGRIYKGWSKEESVLTPKRVA